MKSLRVFTLLGLAFAVQTAHYAEHLAQLVQIYALGVPPPEAHGLLGSLFDFEWVHFVYNLGLEAVLVGLWLLYRLILRDKSANTDRQGLWLLAGLALFQGYHSIEHLAKVYQYLFIPIYQSGLQPTPGILPNIIRWPIFLVHFWLNTVVWIAMVFALWHLRPVSSLSRQIRSSYRNNSI